MGTIIERQRRDGSTAYMAQISIMRDRKMIHRESKTFDRKPAANAWIKKREAELEAPGGLEAARTGKRNPTLEDAIDRYIAESERAMGRTKVQVLRTIKTHDIASKPCNEITSPDIVEFAATLRATVKPQTVSNYLAHLGAVFSIARPAWGFPLDPRAMQDAQTVLKRLGTTAKSGQRDRRPSLAEVDKIIEHFLDRSTRAPASSPMAMIVAFALFSTRRLEEITRIRWDDLDEAGSRVLVRDMKNPGEKAGNHVWCDLPDPAMRIIRAMPRTAETIFPYAADAISARFTRAMKVLGIEDLHLHDMRHEGVSRLFEMGFTIPRAASVSGHRSWASLKRYTHLRQDGDKYAGWKWLDILAPETQKGPPSG